MESSTFESVAVAEMAVMYRVALRLTHDHNDAEDLVGQALLLAARAWRSFDGRYPRSWLLRIMKNEFLARVKKNRMHVALDEREPSSEDIAQRVDDRITVEAIMKALDSIPEKYRLAVVLCDCEEMQYEEAAAVLEVPLGTLRSRLFRGRKALRLRLQGWME